MHLDKNNTCKKLASAVLGESEARYTPTSFKIFRASFSPVFAIFITSPDVDSKISVQS